ncbi:alkaline phosphatase D family protein [Solimonas flava]|uniref:alkaline phosphatase D family protein n=1 Tax=Solimonas flava TaxID=415849 RepID=UPI000412D39B|nr:alkaline phosphatase D family protein [Solimonas flava]
MSRRIRLRRGARAGSLKRRDVLRGLAAAGTLPWLGACGSGSSGGESPAPAAEAGFKHGVASGDPLHDRVILWTRVSGLTAAATVDWVLARDPQLQDVVRRSDDGQDPGQPRTATPARDYTFKVDVLGLAPGSSYYYQFRCGAARSPVGRTRTAPDGQPQRVRLGLVSCSNYPAGYFNAYKVLARRDVDAVVHVGDYFYESGNAGSIGRPADPPYEILTLDDYRRRHAQYRGDADLQALTRQHPLIAVWDDHESANDSWSGGADNHQPDTEGDWNTRKAAAMRAYDEWLPIRLPDPADPSRIWRRLPFGDLVDLFMLDTRLQRNAPATDTSISGTDSDDPSRTMLGLEQRDWLLDGMQASADAGVRWRVLGQQTMMAPHRNNPDPRYSPLPYLPPDIAAELGLRQGGGNEGGDNWGAYAYERDRLMGHWRDHGIVNNVVLSGDIHTSWACDVVEDAYTPYNPLSPAITGVPGYNALTGQGAVAVEFTCMSVSSSNLADQGAATVALAPLYNAAVELANPNVRFHNAAAHGFVLLDITREQVSGEHWNVSTVLAPYGDDDEATLDVAHVVAHGAAGVAGTDHLRRSGAATAARPDAPAPAP